MSGSLTKRQKLQLELPYDVTAVSLTLPDNLPYKEWLAVGEKLQKIGGGLSWWIGDWINHGHAHYERGKYDAAMETFEYEYGVLRNLASVSAKIEMSRRRDNLSWAHHAEVAEEIESVR